jgi:HD-GYP domain-containing protein (c-di-GMP phosphodiesterase class II)
LARYKDFARGMDIVRHHHERWDGAGYPAGLKGLDIPFGARVIAVADSFDAMTSDRPYRTGMLASQAAQILRDGRGQQWEPAIVDAFLRSLNKDQPQPMMAVGRTTKAVTVSVM